LRGEQRTGKNFEKVDGVPIERNDFDSNTNKGVVRNGYPSVVTGQKMMASIGWGVNGKKKKFTRRERTLSVEGKKNLFTLYSVTRRRKEKTQGTLLWLNLAGGITIIHYHVSVGAHGITNLKNIPCAVSLPSFKCYGGGKEGSEGARRYEKDESHEENKRLVASEECSSRKKGRCVAGLVNCLTSRECMRH